MGRGETVGKEFETVGKHLLRLGGGIPAEKNWGGIVKWKIFNGSRKAPTKLVSMQGVLLGETVESMRDNNWRKGEKKWAESIFPEQFQPDGR